MIRDVGSLNGTYVNRERIEEAVARQRRRGADRQVQARLPGCGGRVRAAGRLGSTSAGRAGRRHRGRPGERPDLPVDRRRPHAAAPGVPRRHHLEDPIPREPGPGQPRAHPVGVPQVLRARRRAAALGAAPATRALPAPQGDPGPPGQRGGDRPTPRARVGETVAVMDTSANGSLEAAAPSPERGVVATAARAATASGSTPGSRTRRGRARHRWPSARPLDDLAAGPRRQRGALRPGRTPRTARPPRGPGHRGRGRARDRAAGPRAGSGRPPLTRLVGDVVPAGPARAGSPGASQRQAPGRGAHPAGPLAGRIGPPGSRDPPASPVPRPRHEVPDEPTGSRSPAVGSAPEPGSGEPVAREPLPKAPSGHQSPAEAPTPRTAPPRPQDGGQASAAPSQRAPVPPGGAPTAPASPPPPGSRA